MGRVTSEQSDQTPICSHFSHPHPLKLSNLQSTGAVSSCSACKLEVSGPFYSCTANCDFHLHPKCYELPQQIKHEFDKNHVLTLQPKPVYPEGLFNCDACGNRGDGFSYNCTPCGVDLHSVCASLPMLLTHHCHEHQLGLNFSAPYPGNSFSCDVCKRVSSKTWLYRCNNCEFDVHLTCVAEIIPTVSFQMRSFVPHMSQMVTSRSISQHGNHVMNPSGMGGYGAPMRPQQTQFVATAYPAAMPQANYVPYNNLNQPAVLPPVNYVPYNNLNQPAAMPPVNYVPHNNLNQPAGYGGVGPGNGGLGTQLMVGAANGIASGAAQSVTQAFIQGIMGGGGGGGAGAGGGGGGVDVIVDGGSYYDGGYGGTDAGNGGGDGSSY